MIERCLFCGIPSQRTAKDQLCYACAKVPGAIKRALTKLQETKEGDAGLTWCQGCDSTWTQRRELDGLCCECAELVDAATASTVSREEQAAPAAPPALATTRCSNCDRRGHVKADCANPTAPRRRAFDRRQQARRLHANMQKALLDDAAERQRQDEAAGGVPLEERAAAAALQGGDDQDDSGAADPAVDEELAADLREALLIDFEEEDFGLQQALWGDHQHQHGLDLLTGPGTLADAVTQWGLPEPIRPQRPRLCTRRGLCRGRCSRGGTCIQPDLYK